MAEYFMLAKDADNKAGLSADVFKNIAQTAVERNADVTAAKKESEFVSCKFVEGEVILNLAIKLRLGCNVVNVCNALQAKIYEDIWAMTGLACKNIHLDIVGFTTNEK